MFDDEIVERCPACLQMALRPIMAAEVGIPLLWICTLCEVKMTHEDLLMRALEVEPPKPTLREKMLAVIHRG